MPLPPRTATTDTAAAAALNAQELEALWVAVETGQTNIDSSGAEDIDSNGAGGDECRAAIHVDETAAHPAVPVAVASTLDALHVSKSPASAALLRLLPPTHSKEQASSDTGLSQIDLRRKRNRASMRRARQRRIVELDHLRQQIELLETKLSELQLVRDQTEATPALSASGSPDFSSARLALSLSPQRARMESEMQELFELIKTYQLEQVNLHNAIHSYEKTSVALAQLAEEGRLFEVLARGASTPVDLFQDEEEFLWVNSLLPFLPPLTKARTSEIVRESYLEIMNNIYAANVQQAPAEQVFGWNARHSISSDFWLSFGIEKDFPHADIEELANGSWNIHACTDKRTQFMGSNVHLKILDQLNDDTFVMARTIANTFDSHDHVSIYVFVRVKTSNGYVIGCNPVRPLPQYESHFEAALGGRYIYALQYVGVELTRLEVPDQTREHSSFVPGCRARHGGRIRTSSLNSAQATATRVTLAVVRWENVCVKPMRYLSAE